MIFFFEFDINRRTFSGAVMKPLETPLNPIVAHQLLKSKEQFALVVPDQKSAEKIGRELNALQQLFLDQRQITLFLPDQLLQGDAYINHEYFAETTALTHLIHTQKTIPIVVAERYFQKIPGNLTTRSINKGDLIDVDQLKTELIDSGYQYQAPVEEKGTFQVKGGVVDIFVPLYDDPIRIELFGDEVESIRFFDAAYQRSLHEIDECDVIGLIGLNITPNGLERFETYLKSLYDRDEMTYTEMELLLERAEAGATDREMLKYYPFFYDELTTLNHFLEQENFIIYGYDYNRVVDRLDEVDLKQYSYLFDVKPLKLIPIAPVVTGIDSEYKIQLFGELNDPFHVILQEEKTLFRFSTNMRDYQDRGYTIHIFYQQEQKRSQIKAIFKKFDVPRTGIKWHQGTLVDGFTTGKELFLSDQIIFGRYFVAKKVRHFKNSISTFADLNIGDYVVHVNYGVGQYQGLVSKKILEHETDFLEIHYAKSDKLFVPIHNLHMIHKYRSGDTGEARLDSFGSKKWKVKRDRVKQQIERIAQQLLELYAHRMVSNGYAFSENDELYEDFTNSFPYDLTEDQFNSIATIMHDMERPQPMDRLICGDVGFGKTEVAMRAAFKAVADNKQVAFLAPTTVLAFQHYHTLTERFSDFPINIDFISSFKTPKQKKDVIEKVKRHQLDILIGTQAVLAKTVKFKDLGLLIIDEEQKFGVKDKEKLREMRHQVDTLTLTATPIPRTLNFSLTGIRDLSVITTPPRDRKAVKTIVIKKQNREVKEAIKQELNRGGQIFYVHNRVESIYKEADLLKTLVPELKMAVAHAQMAKSKLELLMYDFYNGKFDLLLSTNIIESGIDIPNANTMIIDRADHFGLASLYQLRGRVGRSERQGYCLLMLPPKKKVTPVAERRLSVISRYTDLGSGFQIAMRDLEIRGAGSLLGFAQKGHMDEIGYEAYVAFLKETLAKMKGKRVLRSEFKVDLNTTFKAVIPGFYINDEYVRLSFYKKLSGATELDEIDDIKAELIDRFGKLPKAAAGMIELIKIKQIAAQYELSKINITQDMIYIKVDHPERIKLKEILTYVTQHSNIKLTQNNEITLIDPINGLESAFERIKNICSAVVSEAPSENDGAQIKDVIDLD